ncbi:substrate-binding periplasmic protein [Thalassotalea castellviae]|uniref:ABC transporter substrate-binding protein n=1 Tax=Thalassotalea castellviae TaxID=3075612 RepID=A0ABU2ZWJ5_9GAMM|nr:ABC transporter substrate-binding protein [Thalassotalea sp. W431]MDT0602307.1 ABC transporter substrate-binding protein [Thalassotalea sp. W431]
MKVFNKTVTFIFLLFSINTFASIQKSLFINDINWPPFFFQEIKDNTMGIGKEIINLCLSEQDYQWQYKNLPIKRTHQNMASGELDISVYSYKKSREDFVIYGAEPIFFSQYGFASNSQDDITINKLDDIKQYQLGHLAGLAHTQELMKIIEEKKALNQVTVGYSIDAMLRQLTASQQRFQILPNSIETLLWRAKQLNIESQLHIHDFVLKQKAYYVTVSKASKHITNPKIFLTKFDACIKALKKSGEYQKISEKYGLISQLALSPPKSLYQPMDPLKKIPFID